MSRLLPIALALAGAAACGSAVAHKTAVVQPGAPGQASAVVSPDAIKAPPAATKGDITFMQGMIHHHAQALDMVDLLDTHSQDAEMKKLALRIRVSQTDEIKTMRHWLEARGQQAPDPRAQKGMAGMDHDMPGMDHGTMATGMMMPGMLTPAQMQELGAARGPAFDRLFLSGMIQHHGGALQMVKDLFATAGAGQQSDVFAFAADVEADQQMEIDRMTAMLKERTK